MEYILLEHQTLWFFTAFELLCLRLFLIQRNENGLFGRLLVCTAFNMYHLVLICNLYSGLRKKKEAYVKFQSLKKMSGVWNGNLQ